MDLRVARRKAGLTQVDCAHLLDVHPSLISRFESGRSTPSIQSICTLSLLYGRSFERLFGEAFASARTELAERLPSLPDAPTHWLPRPNRQHTLNQLSAHLSESENGAA
ncbi:helix-turn-helix transcriptional regulator [Salaquimonas pukyongi]|uniref:helix-turn-helix transcriptional regulator n=1 Tax=Salaquimonas pukyongi TaxID=2712698 RepID=UPI001967968F|nr:helix-turn-helix transcriptional regulator [Salaquimonas pukyongi]